MTHKLDLGDPHEPYSFAEPCRRNPAWMAGFGGDFVHTIPTGPADLDDPRLDRGWDRDFGAFTGLAWACGLTSVALAIGLAIAYFV